MAPHRSLVRRSLAWLAKALPPLVPIGSSGYGGGTWRSVGIVREPFTGAWQQNAAVGVDTAATNPTVYACVTLIASDIAKTCLRLVAQSDAGVWEPTTNPAFTPVLRRPNRYQTPYAFVVQWVLSKLLHGNTYVLKQRDGRGVVVALYVLDPTRVQVLVAPDGGVYYQISRDVLAERGDVQATVPASEVMHDVNAPLFHPLCGVSPIFACGFAAAQGVTMQKNSTAFFANGARPGGILLVPTEIDDAAATTLKNDWKEQFTGDNVGNVAVLAGGLKYEAASANAVDSQLIEQLKWTDEKICSAYHVAPCLVGVGPLPPYANFEPLVQQYYGQCLQGHMTSFEQTLDDGLGLVTPINGTQYGTEFDVDDLIWMDSETRAKAAQQSQGTLSPNEARAKFYGVGPVDGGDSPMVQQQNYSLAALAERDAADPFAAPAPAPTPAPSADVVPPDAIAASVGDLLRARWERAA